MAIALGAWIFHVAALALAPMSVVQAVLSTGVVILAVLADRIFGFKVGLRQWAGVAMTAAGLCLLIVTLPAANGAHSAYSLAGMISFEAGMLVIGALLISGPRLGAPDHHHGVMLGAAAGMLFGVSDVAIKALTGRRRARRRCSSRPWLAIAVLASVVAFYASARGMQEGDAVPVIAATSTAANVSCILGGIVVFGDPMPADTLGIVLQGLAFTMVISPPWSRRRRCARPRPTRSRAQRPARERLRELHQHLRSVQSSRSCRQVIRTTIHPRAARSASRARSPSNASRWPWNRQPSVSTTTRCSGQAKSAMYGRRRSG